MSCQYFCGLYLKKNSLAESVKSQCFAPIFVYLFLFAECPKHLGKEASPHTWWPWLKALKNNLHITPQFYNKFCPRGCSAPKIHGLFKIHKNGFKLRPIVSTFQSPVQIRKMIFSGVPSTFRNSKTLLKKLPLTSLKKSNNLGLEEKLIFYSLMVFPCIPIVM